MQSNPNGHAFVIEDRSAFGVTPEERIALYDAAWAKGRYCNSVPPFAISFVNKAANGHAAADFIPEQDPRASSRIQRPRRSSPILTIPTRRNARPSTPIILRPSIAENVALVDLRATPIEAIARSGIRTRNAEYPLDIIVFATGFDALTGPLLRMDISGAQRPLFWPRHGRAGPRNYLGLQVAGFPNLFTITGPGSPSVLANMPVAIEQHVEWIADCIVELRRRGAARFEATLEAETGWVDHAAALADATLFRKANSWYVGGNIPGKPRVVLPYLGGFPAYRQKCDEVAARGYDGFVVK